LDIEVKSFPATTYARGPKAGQPKPTPPTPRACEPLGVEAIHPDDFLLDLHDLNPEVVRAALEQQAAHLNPTPCHSTSSRVH
jgi:hypothetical protein